MMRSALDAFDGSTLDGATGSAPRTGALGALATPVAPGPPATGIAIPAGGGPAGAAGGVGGAAARLPAAT